MKSFSNPKDANISQEVNVDSIAPDVLIAPNCRILGTKTSIGPGCEIGAEGPVTLENCQLGHHVQLKGGYFTGSVFMDGAHVGNGAHVRAGTILEEKASVAHTVGLKQTVLFPFVTLGSLINFCDILMAGGTDSKNHSEVGSSYIHFNFTPHQDKATASLIGDVPRGVLLSQKPVFLGGQGGLIGPARIAYGSVIAAGGICRKDILEENQLHIPGNSKEVTMPYEQSVYKNIDRILKNNLLYIGNLRALKAWYKNIRTFFLRDRFDHAVLKGALANLDLILVERIKRLKQLAEKMEHSFQPLETSKNKSSIGQKQEAFFKGWEILYEQFKTLTDPVTDADLLREMQAMDQTNYLAVIQNLNLDMRARITDWLQTIVDKTTSLWN